jgi:type IV pilus assembly protein PilW
VNRRHAKGFTLIELMISVVLGLVIVGGVISVMLANKRSYRTNEGLAQIQESARTAFELMSRDIRQSGGNGCDNNRRTANVLNAGTLWWQTWFGVRGIEGADTDPAVADGTTEGLRIAGTDSIHVQSVDARPMPVQTHNPAGTTISLTAAPTPFVVGDAVLVCDFDHAAIFEVTAYDSGTRTITHAASGTAPGNCSSGLGFPTICDGGTGNLYLFPQNSQLSRLSASAWYVGSNERPDEGGRSLYRVRLDSAGVSTTEEIVAGVTDMQVQYRLTDSDDIVDASTLSLADWDNVTSMFITLTIDSADTNVTTDTATNSGRIQRTFTYLVTLRNRVP